MPRRELEQLRSLARAYGVETGYLDWRGERRVASPEALIAVLRSLGVPIGGVADAGRLLDERGREGRELAECLVAWDGRLRVDGIGPGSRCSLETEAGDRVEWTAAEGDLAPRRVPIGRLTLTVGGRGRSGGERRTVTVLSAPRRLPRPAGGRVGVFAPLYALRSRHSWGAGDLRDLRALAEWSAGHGAAVIGTLPMLAAYLDEPFEPSPYAPVSRLFWNEFYLDVPGAAREVGVVPGGPDLAGLRRGTRVDYRAVMAAKRCELERIADAAFKKEATARAIRAFVASRPELEEYAAFRAYAEQRGDTWERWPAGARAGRLPRARGPGCQYHTFVQYLMDRQLRTLRTTGAELYLDLPVGVHARGYDTWRHGEDFVQGVSVGAPPDALFEGGQSWGFPPPHPERSRRDGHAYLAACLRNHFTYCKLLRIDHVMGLYRLFWIPEGIDTRDGVYVRYPVEELFAVLSIEAHRAGAGVIGENLGTVPEEVNRAMDRHGTLRMFVGQFALSPDEKRPMATAPAGHLAGLNTHDTPTFAGYLSGKEIDLRLKLGLIDRRGAAAERAARDQIREAILRFAAAKRGERRADAPAALRSLLMELAASDAEIVLVTLEDLWLETEPQNVPGVAEFPAWRRKCRKSLEQIGRSREFGALIEQLMAARGRPGGRRPRTRGARR